MFIQYARLIDFLSQVWRPGRILANHYATESVAYTETMTVVTFKVEIDLMHRDANEDVHWLHYGWQDHTSTADSI